MKFTLTITLGNAEMTTGEHLAGALREVADKVEALGDADLSDDGLDIYDAGGGIRDNNGNTVGKWSL